MNSKSKWWEKCSWEDNDMPRPINPTEFQIFVGGLNPAVDEAHLREIFTNQVGPVWDVVVLRFRDGRSRGFGLVQFLSKDSLDKAMDIGEIEIHGTIVKLRLAVEKREATSQAKLLFKKKVVIFGIKEGLDEDTLMQYFQDYGKIEKTFIFRDPLQNAVSRPGFIQFEVESSVCAVLEDIQLPKICTIKNQVLLIYSGEAKGVYVKAWRNFFLENSNLPTKRLQKELTDFAKKLVLQGPTQKKSEVGIVQTDQPTSTKPNSHQSIQQQEDTNHATKRKNKSSHKGYPIAPLQATFLKFNMSMFRGSRQAALFNSL
jgi:RNA recognition motif-containing protein